VHVTHGRKRQQPCQCYSQCPLVITHHNFPPPETRAPVVKREPTSRAAAPAARVNTEETSFCNNCAGRVRPARPASQAIGERRGVLSLRPQIAFRRRSN
jgi:hypothetical protein